jgi:cystathionine gamma-synthase
VPDGFETRAIHAGQPADPATGAVVAPISLSTTFEWRSLAAPNEFSYARAANPTRRAYEECVASLEGAAHGYAFASGMAAEDAVLRLLGPGDGVVVGRDVYGGTYRLLESVFAPRGITLTVVDIGDVEGLAGRWPDDTRVVWVESPTNPSLLVVDIAAVAAVAHRNGARVVVDNTFATPYLQRPLELGADVVVHSATKYLGGHSDVIGGFVALDDDALAEEIAFVQNRAGAVPSPFDCYLVLRGVKTLAVRMDRHCENARAVVAMLAEHPAVAHVLYPGLPNHPGHGAARRQMRDFGGMVSFLVAGGEAAAREVVERTRLFKLAESLGGVESLIGHSASMSHAASVGTPTAVDPALVRVSVGLETSEDLVADLERALAGVGRADIGGARG